ncbi:MAG: hypothetical protein O9353_12870, partial [Bacteroidia bacterium]|nr:hypothetical protein [Bacteroidia bacterium]
AQFPGGFTELREQLMKSALAKLPSGAAATTLYTDKLSRAVLKFTVNEYGKITDVSMSNTSTDPFIDTLLIDAAYHLPTWTAAKNAKGQRVKQHFTFSLGSGGC